MPTTFDWNDDKAAANRAKHGVPFDAAVDLFLGNARLDFPDQRANYGEERRNTTGVVDGAVLTVTYTPRGAVCRIISVRPASRKERRRHDDHP